MKHILIKLWELFLKQLKFAASGVLATSIDYVLYLLLVYTLFAPVPSNVASYSIAMVINFLMQKKFVFNLRGSVFNTFVLSVCVSIGGLLLSTAIIYSLNQIPFYSERQYLAKLITTAIVFFYNFFFKRLVFEKCFGSECDTKEVESAIPRGGPSPN